MKIATISTIAALAVSLSASTAFADPHDWAGPYVGLNYGKVVDGGADLVGLQAGYGFDAGRLVYGAEIEYQRSLSSSSALVSLAGRAGVKVSDKALVFAILGYGSTTSGGTQYVLAGIGAEYGFGNQVSARIEVDYLAPNSGSSITMAKIGLTYGF